MKLAPALLALAALTACSAGRPFSSTIGNLHLSGDVSESPFSQTGTLNLQIADAATGSPVDVREVEVKAGRTRAVRASREQRGHYRATIADRQRVDLFITTQDNRSVFVALQQQ
jgi:hypothetical protein